MCLPSPPLIPAYSLNLSLWPNITTCWPPSVSSLVLGPWPASWKQFLMYLQAATPTLTESPGVSQGAPLGSCQRLGMLPVTSVFTDSSCPVASSSLLYHQSQRLSPAAQSPSSLPCFLALPPSSSLQVSKLLIICLDWKLQSLTTAQHLCPDFFPYVAP